MENKRSKMKLNIVSSLSLNNEHKLFYPTVEVSLPKKKRGRPSLKSKLFNEQQVQFGSEVVIEDTAEDYIE
jgi:hypothetical protein